MNDFRRHQSATVVRHTYVTHFEILVFAWVRAHNLGTCVLVCLDETVGQELLRHLWKKGT